jgi:hypothetical protein
MALGWDTLVVTISEAYGLGQRLPGHSRCEKATVGYLRPGGDGVLSVPGFTPGTHRA